jgi:hypothetical protein
MKNLAHFINAVGELIATIFDMHHGFPMRNVAAINIRDTAHRISP